MFQKSWLLRACGSGNHRWEQQELQTSDFFILSLLCHSSILKTGAGMLLKFRLGDKSQCQTFMLLARLAVQKTVK